MQGYLALQASYLVTLYSSSKTNCSNCEGVEYIPLPAYSPELNIIEILWRKIKYEWLSFGATESLTSLRNELFDILKNIGGEYTIAYS